MLAAALLLVVGARALPRLYPPLRLGSGLEEWRREHEAMAVWNDAALASIRQQAKARMKHAWTEEDFLGWLREVGAEWKADIRTTGVQREVVLSVREPELSHLPANLQAMRTWLARGKPTCTALEITASGVDAGRRLTRAALEFRLRVVAPAGALPSPSLNPNQP